MCKTKENQRIRYIFFLMLFGILMMLFSQHALAAGNTGETVELEVNQTFFVDLTDQFISSEFTYTLTPQNASNPMPYGTVDGVYTFKMTNDDSVKIPIVFTNSGTYKYYLRQVVLEKKPGYTYDNEVFTITVIVRNRAYNNPSGSPFPELGSGEENSSNLQLSIFAQRGDGNKIPDLNFGNDYKPLPTDPDLMVDPPVKKTVSGTPPEDAEFNFQLVAADKNQPMPEGSVDGVKTLTIIGEGENDFGTWSYYAAGTYLYTISEVKGNNTEYTYDTTVYTITDVVTDVNGQLILNRTVTNADTIINSCDFTNIYNGDKPNGDIPNDDIPNDDTNSDITNGAEDDKVNGPKTGDDTSLWIWGIVFTVSLAIVAGCKIYQIAKKRKISQNEE